MPAYSALSCVASGWLLNTSVAAKRTGSIARWEAF
jgi:hypothetical protein